MVLIDLHSSQRAFFCIIQLVGSSIDGSIVLISYSIRSWIKFEGLATQPPHFVPGLFARSKVRQTQVCKHVAGLNG